MVSWNLPSRFGGRKGNSSPAINSNEGSDSSSQQDVVQTPQKVVEPIATVTRTRRCFFDLKQSKVYPHIRLDDLTNEEYDNMWITAEEFMASKKEYVAVVRQMMKTLGDFPETEDCCPRGLEFKTKDGARRRKRTKQRACFAVLEEQEIQRDEGVCDPEFLADVYKEMSSQSSLEALNRGLKDQKAMLDLLGDEDRMKWEQQKGPSKGNSVLELPLRRRSVTETLNGADMLQVRRTVTVAA